MEANSVSSEICETERKITRVQLRDEFYILGSEDMSKRETIGKRLYRARIDQGLSVRQLIEKISEGHNADVSVSTVLGIEKDRTPNPGFKTIEYIALGLGLDPLEVIALGLDDPPEMEPGFRESQFAQMWRSYKQIGSKEHRQFADELIKMLRERISKWN